MPRRNPESRAAVLFLLPSLTGTAVFVLVPFLETVRRSFCDAAGRQFVGLTNYRSVVQNAAFRLAVRNTARFLGVCVPLLLAASLLLALGVRAVARRRDGTETRRGRLFRTSFLLPMAIPVASIVILWQVLFANNGLVNGVLSALGRPPVDFMGTGAAFWVLVLTYVWKNAGYDMILWLAGLDGIPADLYEAAAVDGANAWQKFFCITLPNLLPTLGLVGMLSLLNSFKAFREAFLVGGSYPDKSMYLLQHLFNNWFLSLDLPRLTAAAVLTALALSGLIFVLQRVLTRDDCVFFKGGFPMRKIVSLAAAACALLLTGCGSPAGSAASLSGQSVRPSPAPAVTAAPSPEPSATQSALFDVDAAAYDGLVEEQTDTGFLLCPTVVDSQSAGSDGCVMAQADTGSAFAVTCPEDTCYLAIYADGNGTSRQEEGTAEMIRENAYVYITGSMTDDGFIADTVAILNP